jgi:hypothetical protein
MPEPTLERLELMQAGLAPKMVEALAVDRVERQAVRRRHGFADGLPAGEVAHVPDVRVREEEVGPCGRPGVDVGRRVGCGLIGRGEGVETGCVRFQSF